MTFIPSHKRRGNQDGGKIDQIIRANILSIDTIASLSWRLRNNFPFKTMYYGK
jgi:hypothetical protein